MSLASQGIELQPLYDCYIRVGSSISNKIQMYTLPDISDSHEASYGEETGIGRSMPVKTFGSGTNRTISWNVTFVANSREMLEANLKHLRLLQAATYPRDNAGVEFPYAPPPLCYIRCGDLLANGVDEYNDPIINNYFTNVPRASQELCVICKSCSVKFPKDVPWSDLGYIPYKFDVSLAFEVVYATDNLPGAERIASYGA